VTKGVGHMKLCTIAFPSNISAGTATCGAICTHSPLFGGFFGGLKEPSGPRTFLPSWPRVFG